MKVCLINNLYKPYARGGAETVVELIADGLRNAGSFGYAQDGHEVFIVTTKKRRQTADGRRQKIYYVNSIYYDLNKLPKFLRLFWHFIDMFDVGSYFAVRRILKKEKPDVVMTHNLKGIGYLIPRAIRNLKIKHIHTLHDIQLLHPSGLMLYGKEKTVNGVFSKLYQFICRRLFGSPDTIISPSKWLLEEYTNRGFFKYSKKAVLPNPMGDRQRTTDNKQQGVFKFLYVGLIEDHKGILFLIKAFKKAKAPLIKGLAPRRDEALPRLYGEGGVGGILKFELLIAGGGSKLKQAQELVGENKNIKLLGRVSNNEVMELMRSSDCLIVPSFCYENSPTVIYEAMSMGLPVIASRIGGVPELVGGDLLFEPKNEEDLIDKIKQAIRRKDEIRKAAEAKQEAIKNFGIQNYISGLMKLF